MQNQQVSESLDQPAPQVPVRPFDAEAVAVELREGLPSLETALAEIAEAQKVTRETLELEFTI